MVTFVVRKWYKRKPYYLFDETRITLFTMDTLFNQFNIATRNFDKEKGMVYIDCMLITGVLFSMPFIVFFASIHAAIVRFLCVIEVKLNIFLVLLQKQWIN